MESPPPSDFQVGMTVRLLLNPTLGIQTTFDRQSPINSLFQVDDIIGSRVVLNPFRGSTWLPTRHEACSDPMGWGYDLKTVNVRTSMHSTKYGYGTTASFLEYVPDHSTDEERLYVASRIVDDWYRGTKEQPGWNY
jgi:hypothetical protein